MILGWHDGAETDLPDPVADHERTPRLLEAGQELAVGELGPAVVQRLLVGVDGDHRSILRPILTQSTRSPSRAM